MFRQRVLYNLYVEKSGNLWEDSALTITRRAEMVVDQIRARGISDQRVLDAFGRVQRHAFVPDELIDAAYQDRPLPIGHNQTISQPYIVAFMTEALALRGGEKVLEVGTGSGYQAAILAQLAGKVHTIERLEILITRARQALEGLNILNVTFYCGDGSLGLPQAAPFDAIMVTAAAPHVPQALLDQLAIGGRLVLPVGDRWQQKLQRITKGDTDYTYETILPVAFVPLIGAQGWQDGQFDE